MITFCPRNFENPQKKGFLEVFIYLDFTKGGVFKMLHRSQNLSNFVFKHSFGILNARAKKLSAPFKILDFFMVKLRLKFKIYE